MIETVRGGGVEMSRLERGGLIHWAAPLSQDGGYEDFRFKSRVSVESGFGNDVRDAKAD
jgi:hypothetical protein